MNHYPHISAMLFDQPWAITPRALESMIARVEGVTEVQIDAIAAKIGRPLENTGNRVELRGGVAVLDVTGPIFRYANLMTAVSGATSLQVMATDFQAALENPNVRHILLNVDSAGGEVAGIADMAEAIRAGQKLKPVT